MGLATAEQLLKPVPLKDETRTIEGLGDVRFLQLSFADHNKLSLWLFPDGKIDKERQAAYGLKLATLCIVDKDGKRLFEFPDTPKGNKAFFEFAEPVNNGGGGDWVSVIEAARDINNDDEDEPDLPGK